MNNTHEVAAGEDGFATEVVTLRPTLRTRAMMLLQNEAAADDLVQDTIERALSSRRLFRDGTSLKAWLASIMRNIFIDGWRRTALHPNVDPDNLPSNGDSPGPLGPIDFLTTEDVRTAMACLRPQEREIFELAYFQRVCHRAIAARFRIQISTVGTSLFRSRKKVRAALEAMYRRRRGPGPC
jgi:RNA polymerase sigma-70 factor, ECF subfamily